MATGPCIADTNSIDLAMDGSDNLTATLREHPAGALHSDGSGVYVGVHPTGGLQIASDLIAVKPQGPGLSQDGNGLAKIDNFTYTGWVPFIGDDTQVHNFAIARGALTQVGPSLSLNVAVNQSIATVVRFRITWRGAYSVNYPGLGDPSNILDSVAAILQFNYDNGGWGSVDQGSIGGASFSTSFSLHADVAVGQANNTTHNIQARLLVFGGTTSATARQGVLNTSYQRGISAWW